MTGHEIAIGQTAYALGNLARRFQESYPGIGPETAVAGLHVLCGALRDCSTIGEATAVFRDRVNEAFDRGEVWALDIQKAALLKERT